jgi:hypothetical protein
MPAEAIFILVVIFLGWAVINAPSRFLIPVLISQQLGSKDARLKKKLNEIPLFRITKRADSIENLLKKPQNIRFMSMRFPVTFRWYRFSKRWCSRIMIGFAALVLLSQLWGLGKFLVDPKGELERTRSAAEQWRNDRRND